MELHSTLSPLLTNKSWYHQRFDGSPLFLYFVGSADTVNEPRKPKGTDGDIGVCFFEHNRADWYFDVDDINKGARAMIAAAKGDPEISTKLLKQWKKDEQRFSQFFWEEFPRYHLPALTDKELTDLLSRCFTLFVKATSSTSIIDRFALGTDDIIDNMIREELSHFSQHFKESEFVNIFTVLTAPVHLSFINKAEIDLLKIIINTSKITLEQYQKKYFWIQNNYATARELTTDHFRDEISSWEQSGKNLEETLELIQQSPQRNKREKHALLNKLTISPHLRTLLKISEDFTWWQDERKKYTYFNIHMGIQILSEIARRKDYTTDALTYAIIPEIESIMEHETPSREELQKRQNSSVMILTKKHTQILSGTNAQHVRSIMLDNRSTKSVDDFRGLSASTGRVIGPVKVVMSATEIQKVTTGDILVAVMTRPDYVAAMKKAAAIVTNEGGITSHAAIVSRELNIPCIIGTKIATDVLKDGDIVEVNANHGWVRKLK